MNKKGDLYEKIFNLSVLFLMLVAFTAITSCETGQDFVIDTTPPSPVTELKAEAGEGIITLTWKDPSDSDLYGIKIYNASEAQSRTASFGDGVLIGKGIQKFEAGNLKDGVSYTFKVSAVDAAMNESAIAVTEPVVFAEKVKEITVTKYVCPNCDKEYDTAQEAADCCGVQEKEIIKEVKTEVKVDKTYAAAVTFTSEDLGESGMKVKMATTTEEAVIYYTTDGQDPTKESTKYEGPLTFTADATIKAVAVKEGIENSPVSVANIFIKTKTLAEGTAHVVLRNVNNGIEVVVLCLSTDTSWVTRSVRIKENDDELPYYFSLTQNDSVINRKSFVVDKFLFPFVTKDNTYTFEIDLPDNKKEAVSIVSEITSAMQIDQTKYAANVTGLEVTYAESGEDKIIKLSKNPGDVFANEQPAYVQVCVNVYNSEGNWVYNFGHTDAQLTALLGAGLNFTNPTSGLNFWKTKDQFLEAFGDGENIKIRPHVQFNCEGFSMDHGTYVISTRINEFDYHR